jgi:hypothetical protein
MKEQNWKEKYGDFAKDMTLRDYYAGLAMQGFIAAPDCGWSEEEIPERAYAVADAMLKAREAK